MKQTEEWVESKGAEYAYGYDKGGKWTSWFGVSGYPSAVLINASGEIVWKGHPGSLQRETVEEAIQGALTLPMWEWPEETDKVKRAISSRKFGKAIDEATKLGDSGKPFLEALQAMVAGRVSGLKALYESEDWLAFHEGASVAAKELKGLPEEEELEGLLKALKKNKDAKKIMDVQEKIQKIFADRIKKGDFDKHERYLRHIAETMPGTAAERDANKALDRLIAIRGE